MLDRWIVCQAEEKYHTLHRPALLEVGVEETGRLHVHPHGPTYDDIFFLMGVLGVLELTKVGLVGNLGDNLVVGEVGGGEDQKLPPGRNGVYGVDGGDDGLDHHLGAGAGREVDRYAGGVEVGLGQHLGGRGR